MIFMNEAMISKHVEKGSQPKENTSQPLALFEPKNSQILLDARKISKIVKSPVSIDVSHRLKMPKNDCFDVTNFEIFSV